MAPSVKTWTFTVPPFSVEHQVRLSLECRIDSDRLRGSNPWIRVGVNGQYVAKPDLLNKTHEFTLRNGLDLTWSKHGMWRVLYSPDFRAAVDQKDYPYACPDADPYRFVWDITRYVRPGANTLVLHHMKKLAKPSTLVVRNVKVQVGKAVSAPESGGVTPAPTGPLPLYTVDRPRRTPMRVALSPDGGFILSVAGKRLEVTTRTSLPNGKWHEAGVDGAGPRKTAAWTAGVWRIERAVTVRRDHVHVADTLTNTSGGLAGAIVEHRVACPGKAQDVYVAGRKAFGPRSTARNPAHPSVFALFKGLGVGLAAEDDVMRVHVRSFTEPGALGLADDRLGLEPGKSVTHEWSIYALPNADYWAFVNAVRRNWGANFTIPGPFCYTMHLPENKPAEWYGKWVTDRSLKIVCGGIAKYPNGKYAHGTGIEHAPKWVARERHWTQSVIKTAPGVKALAYFHAQCCTEPNGETTYADSRLIDAKGVHLSYPYRYRLPLYLPTRENRYGKALWGYVRTCLEDIGTSGLYWDEMTHSVLWYARDAQWDGVSAAIDPDTHAVRGKVTSVPLVMQPLKLDIVRRLRERGLFLMANTQPATRTMLDQKIVRFVETGTYSAVANTHLGCPLGLGNHHPENTHADSTRNVRRILMHGGLYYGHGYRRDPAPWNFTSVMFPITPEAIGPGYVLGRERIHTAVSGRFAFTDGDPADVYVVNADGARLAGPQVKVVKRARRHEYEIRMPSDHFAILVSKGDRGKR